LRGCRFLHTRFRGHVRRYREFGGQRLSEEMDRKTLLRDAGRFQRAQRRGQHGVSPTDADVRQTLGKRFAVGGAKSVKYIINTYLPTCQGKSKNWTFYTTTDMWRAIGF